MGVADTKYELDGVIEMDDAFFKTHFHKDKENESKRGRGTRERSKVLILAKVDPKPQKKDW